MRFGVCLNLKNIAMTQYRNFDFNSMCIFNGKPIAASSGGIFSLNDAESDNGVAINSLVELPTSDLGVFSSKRFRSLYIGYETSGFITISAKVDGKTEKLYRLIPDKTRQIQHRSTIPMPRAQFGTYWLFKIQNVSGGDFSIDHIQGIPVVLSRGRK